MTTPTAEMPMPGGAQQLRLLDALENASLYELWLELAKLAEELPRVVLGFPVTSTTAALLGEKANGWPMTELLVSMEPTVIRAIVGGTVAYDTRRGVARWFNTPRVDSVPGVYVVGLRIKGRGGKFLTITETEALIQGIENYIKGFELIQKIKSNPLPLCRADAALLDWVCAVDGRISASYPGGTSYIKEPTEIPGVNALVASFKRRCNRALDPTGQVHQVQSPVYVGCSRDLRTRMSHYHDPSRYKSLNKPLMLTINVLNALGMACELEVRVATLIWKQAQLPIAEQLVATLAGSMVYQYGFNATEAGGAHLTTRPLALQFSREQIMGHSPTMRQNIEKMLAELKMRESFAEDLSSLQASLSNLETMLQEYRDRPAVQPVSEQLAELRAIKAGLEDSYARAKETKEVFDAALVLAEAIWPQQARQVRERREDKKG